MLYLEIGTPADYSIAFLRDLAGLKAGTPSQSQSELPPGIEVGAFGMTGTPESMDAAEYFVVFVDDYNNEEGVLPIGQGDPTVPPQHLPLTLPVTDLELGIPYVIDVDAAGPEEADGSTTQDAPPPGMVFDEYGSVLEGIPSEAGEYALTLNYMDMWGDPLPGDVDVEIHVAGPEDPDPDPDPEDPEDPEVPEEWLHLLDEDPARALVASTLAPRALRHAGTDPDTAPAPALAMAEGHLATVLEYVKGYTRGRGFHGYIPERPLQAVIVAATGRLTTNPEQVTYYSTGDYSERPATLTGWTLAELQVLRRYRRVTA